jgi:predicted component of type VI protein secretion system
MINIDQEFYSSPYYFLMRDKGDKYSLYFSVENTLTEARKKDEVIHFDKKKGDKIKNRISKIAKEKKHKDTKSIKKDLEELVNTDGSIASSKIPILDPRLHPKKTMDQTISSASITNDPITRGYRTYYGESKESDGEVIETDMSGAFGYDETKDMDGKETYIFYKDELEMNPDEAKERTKQQGKDPSGKKDKKSKYKNDKNFVTRATLSEIQKQKAIKMVEDMLAKKEDGSSSDITKKKPDDSSNEVPQIIKRNIKTLINQAEKQGLSKKELIKLLQSE